MKAVMHGKLRVDRMLPFFVEWHSILRQFRRTPSNREHALTSQDRPFIGTSFFVKYGVVYFFLFHFLDGDGDDYVLYSDKMK